MSDTPVQSPGLVPYYPDDFPAEAVRVIISYFRGQTVEVKCLAHAAWIVQGFAQGKVLPDVHPEPLPIASIRKESVQAQLEALLHLHDHPEQRPAASSGVQIWGIEVDWRSLVAAMLRIIAGWIDNLPA